MVNYSRIGVQSRKLGITVNANTRKDDTGMDSIDDFFNQGLDDDEEEEDSTVVKEEYDADSEGQPYADASEMPDIGDTPDEDFVNATGMSPVKPRKKRYSRRLDSSPLEGASPASVRSPHVGKRTPLEEPVSAETLIQNLDQLSPDSDIDDGVKKGKAVKKTGNLAKKGGSITKQIALTKRKRKMVIPPTQETPNSEDEQEPIFDDDEGQPQKTSRSASVTEEGLRRSKRTRVKPLAYWRNERVIYEPVQEAGAHLSVIKSVARNDMQAPSVTARKTSRSSSASTTRKKTQTSALNVSELEGAEWLKDGHLTAELYDTPNSNHLTMRKIAFNSGNPEKETEVKGDGEDYKIFTLFDQDSEFAGGGFIEIPVGGSKAEKPNTNTYFIFYVAQGVLRVRVSGTEFVVSGGCAFEIPMGNLYEFSNIGNSTAKLFFVQTRLVVVQKSDSFEYDS
ncbi:unnamed protein product [Kuraishia capsulata CBS 1993]|uniref:Uncharacterized protein n=1 Tax=Kuraishia capsulata CBS 1993 TaxID=1382522 RepID=W6MQC9_9ASCO|nr:uncharacterized protein KUCA_T00000055001 [Kuraishia capsulata CBS 1993]CDK24095.1 unnamed protein product [Kuraishia capsulata CBS 1993]